MKNRNIIYMFLGCLAVFTSCEDIPQYTLPEVETMEASSTADEVVMQGMFALENTNGVYARRAFEFSNEDSDYSLSSNRYYFDDEATEISTTEVITVKMQKLSPATTYYYRAVLVPLDERMSKPVYGQVMSVTTTEMPKIQVTVTTEDAWSVTSKTARMRGRRSVKNGKIIETGLLIAYNTTTPTISNNAGKSTYEDANSFSTFWYRLKTGTKYYYRAYAIDENKKVYYGEIKSFTTKTEPGGNLTVNDFIGTFTATANSPWESKTLSWTDVQIIPYSGDTVIAVGWNGRDELRAVGIFEKGLQIIRFESDWYFEAYTFDVDGYSCAAVFMPAYYYANNNKAYLINTGGRELSGEIWLSKNGNKYTFEPCDSDSDEGYYANGFIFDYYSLSDWEKRGHSQVYKDVSMTRTSATTTRYLPPLKRINDVLHKNTKKYHEPQTTSADAFIAVSVQH